MTPPYNGLILTGPTASGKSKAALDLAQEIGGEIINADSMQLYQHLPLLTACPPESHQKRVPHHLYQILGDQDLSSAGWWYERVSELIIQVREREKIPLIVGGTGLYLYTLVHGLREIPPIPESIRQHIRELAGQDHFYALVVKEDPLVARKLHPKDTQRLCRALEVKWATGKSIDEWPEKGKGALRFHQFALTPPKSSIDEIINRRFDLLMEKGALGEVEHLLKTPIRPDSPILRAVGVPELTAFLKGEITYEDAVSHAKQSTRQYAKRQYTWLRNRGGDYTCFSEWSEENKQIIKNALACV